jgi:hypothetical protein
MSSPVVVTTELLLFKRQKYMNDERTAYLRKYHFVAVEQLALDIRLEPPRVCRRPICLSHAAMA